ncbi:hypothetical protein AusDCA_2179 [Desulfitobacterium sp. AusDCA]
MLSESISATSGFPSLRLGFLYIGVKKFEERRISLLTYANKEFIL